MSAHTVTLRNCQFAFRCPKTWDTLQQGESDEVRYCTDCENNVYLCRTDGELAEAIQQNKCVAIVLANEDSLDFDEEAKPKMQIGVPAIHPYLPGR